MAQEDYDTFLASVQSTLEYISTLKDRRVAEVMRERILDEVAILNLYDFPAIVLDKESLSPDILELLGATCNQSS
jgi:hypothetical protein